MKPWKQVAEAQQQRIEANLEQLKDDAVETIETIKTDAPSIFEQDKPSVFDEFPEDMNPTDDILSLFERIKAWWASVVEMLTTKAK